jgi:uncharacterized OB-fold protein
MEIPQHWRLNAQRYALTGTVCEVCGTAHFPPRAVCSACVQNGHAEQPVEVVVLGRPVRAARQARANGRVAVRLAHNPA